MQSESVNIVPGTDYNILKINAMSMPFTEGSEIFSELKSGCFICTDGWAEIQTLGGTLRISKGDLLFYNTASLFKILHTSHDIKGYLAVLEVANLVAMMTKTVGAYGLLQLRVHPLAHLDEEQHCRITEQLEELSQELEALRNLPDDVFSRIERECICSKCLTATLEILKIYFTRQPLDANLHHSKYGRVFDNFLINAHKYFRQNRKIEFYAHLERLSPKYFSNIIRKASGSSPVKIIDMLIVSEAKRMLSSTGMSVKEISAYLGFESQSFFGRYFKKHTGVTPAAYRVG